VNSSQIIIRILLVRWLLKRKNYHETSRILSLKSQKESLPDDAVGPCAADIVTWCDRVPGTRCLARSLVLWSLLKEKGQKTQLRIGIRPIGTAIEAHAWIEWQGAPLLEAEDPMELYTVFEGDLADLRFRG
jgi:hypothetical protein